MALFSQFQTFFVSPFGEASVADELNRFLRGHRIINVEERKTSGQYQPKTDWREVPSFGT